jgi:hypothetical protein
LSDSAAVTGGARRAAATPKKRERMRAQRMMRKNKGKREATMYDSLYCIAVNVDGELEGMRRSHQLRFFSCSRRTNETSRNHDRARHAIFSISVTACCRREIFRAKLEVSCAGSKRRSVATTIIPLACSFSLMFVWCAKCLPN